MEAMSTRPRDTVRSYQLIWKGTTPHIQESNWSPGYTKGHKATIDEAVKFGMQQLTEEISRDRERWIKLTALIAAMVEQDMEEGEGDG
jgi:hypothetical protein